MRRRSRGYIEDAIASKLGRHVEEVGRTHLCILSFLRLRFPLCTKVILILQVTLCSVKTSLEIGNSINQTLWPVSPVVMAREKGELGNGPCGTARSDRHSHIKGPRAVKICVPLPLLVVAA